MGSSESRLTDEVNQAVDDDNLDLFIKHLRLTRAITFDYQSLLNRICLKQNRMGMFLIVVEQYNDKLVRKDNTSLHNLIRYLDYRINYSNWTTDYLDYILKSINFDPPIEKYNFTNSAVKTAFLKADKQHHLSC
jgi:hypothetical protein